MKETLILDFGSIMSKVNILTCLTNLGWCILGRLSTDYGNLSIVINHLIVKLEVNDDSAVDPCGSNKPLIIKDSISGNITSPRYPNPYLSNLDCEWEIHAQDGEAVVIKLRDIYIEKGWVPTIYI